MIQLRVPATSANIGSGFDELGLALQLYAYFSFEFSSHYRYQGMLEKYQADNLIKEAYEITCDKENFPKTPLFIGIESDIPISRGLGSSSSLIVAGVSAAYVLHTHTLPKDKIFKISNEIEGHPDNVAPAIYGGLIQSVKENDHFTIKSLVIHPLLHFTFLIPDFELSTKLARSVLPLSYSKELLDLKQTKITHLIQGLEKADFALIKDGCDDVIHQPYRFPLIKDFECIQKYCIKKGIETLFLSGAGPTLGLITNQSYVLELHDCTASWTQHELNIDLNGVTLV